VSSAEISTELLATPRLRDSLSEVGPQTLSRSYLSPLGFEPGKYVRFFRVSPPPPLNNSIPFSWFMATYPPGLVFAGAFLFARKTYLFSIMRLLRTRDPLLLDFLS